MSHIFFVQPERKRKYFLINHNCPSRFVILTHCNERTKKALTCPALSHYVKRLLIRKYIKTRMYLSQIVSLSKSFRQQKIKIIQLETNLGYLRVF